MQNFSGAERPGKPYFERCKGNTAPDSVTIEASVYSDFAANRLFFKKTNFQEGQNDTIFAISMVYGDSGGPRQLKNTTKAVLRTKSETVRIEAGR